MRKTVGQPIRFIRASVLLGFFAIIGKASTAETLPYPRPLPAPPALGMPVRTDLSKRVGIVYSGATANQFFSKFAYSQLYMAMQHQAMMAGVPFDLLNENSLTNIAHLVNYDALLIPFASNVSERKRHLIAETLNQAVYQYKIGLITAGDFLSFDEKNRPVKPKPFPPLQHLFGLQKVADLAEVSVKVTAETTTHPVMQDYAKDELICEWPKDYLGAYGAVPGQPFTILAEMKTGRHSRRDHEDEDEDGRHGGGHARIYPAVIATETGGRNVHFANAQVIGNCNLVWPALRWVVFGEGPAVGLKLTRHKSLFTARNDMDQSKIAREIARVEIPLYHVIKDWKTRYGFVGSFFINIGKRRHWGEYTDWNISGPLYQDYLTLGNEIGTHSYTHPENVNLLTPEQIEFEFNQSKKQIEQQLGITVYGAAIPGVGEKLSIDRQLENYFSYVSGRYSNLGSGYPGAFGWLNPTYDMLYFCHNLHSDFALIQFQKMTPAQAANTWSEQFVALTQHTAQPIIHWLWHDYGPTTAGAAFGFNYEMYDSLLARAYIDYTEFATMLDVHNRIKTFREARLAVNPGPVLSVTISGQNLGQFCLVVPAGKTIASVDNWYAYNEDAIFLPQTGGTFNIHLGEEPAERTHIIYLPMRARLLGLQGDGRGLSFTFEGEGQVGISLNAAAGETIAHEGADSASRNGNVLALTFNGYGLHAARVTVR